MKFTYKAYINMLNLLKANDYEFCKYGEHSEEKKFVILRHDIDMDLEKALELAKLEYKNGVNSTYFVLLSTDFYNIFSKKSNDILTEIISLGHDIGLHFDELRYNCKDIEDVKIMINKEVEIICKYMDYNIKSVSMHRPSNMVLDNDIKINGLINSYSKEYFEDFKYLSDSRMHWREDVEEIIVSQKYKRLHILTHPFWYKDEEEGMREVLFNFIKQSKYKTFNNVDCNFKNLSEVINISDI